MQRKEFLAALEQVAPALSHNPILPVLTHFWFYGDRVMAYNDEIALSTPLETPFKGAVPGTTLLDLLHASGARTLSFAAEDGQLIIKAGRATLKLALRPVSDFLFEMPDYPKGTTLAPVEGSLPKAIEGCLRSISTDAAIPEQLGITLVPDGHFVDLYSTDSDTLSHDRIKVKRPPRARVILPAAFCREFLRLSKGTPGHLSLTDFALMQAGDTMLYGRFIETRNPLDFAGIIAEHVASKKKLYPMPKGFGYALDRAVVITDAKVDQALTALTVKEGRLRLESRSGRGEVIDEFAADDKQPRVAVKIKPKLLKQGHKDFDELLITVRCAVMSKGDTLYLVSAI